jgi:transcriptional regulator with XRE-family HTH domain
MNVELHKFVLDELEKAKGRWGHVAQATGISRRTISKIAREEIPNPGIKSVEQLARYFVDGSQEGAA